MKRIETFDTPVMQDSIVQTLNALIVDYVEYQFGIVHLGTDEEGETYPSVYKNDGSFKNYMIFPDNRVQSFGFWEFDGADVLDDNDGVNYNLTFVFWGNLQRIDRGKLYDFTTEIEQSVLHKFINAGALDVNYTQDDVFGSYSKYQEKERQTLMRPNTGFRISFKIHDVTPC